MKIEEKIEQFLKEKPSYLKESADTIISRLELTFYDQDSYDSMEERVIKIRRKINKELKLQKKTRSEKFASTAIKKSWSDLSSSVGLKIQPPVRRLFLDIETSPNIVTAWNIGRKINISAEDIIKERGIICVCWKWEGTETCGSLKWNKGNDKFLLKQIVNLINNADEIIGHNSDNFDIKWIKTRALLHGYIINQTYKAIDTLKLARKHFRFNSNRLDYIAKFLGLEGKTKTEYKMWTDIVLRNDEDQLNKMVEYCINDVIVLENVYNKLRMFDKKLNY